MNIIRNMPRSSIIVSDEPLSEETNYRTEFVAVLSDQPQGGFITRNFGKPAEGVHAVQMELACRSYMHEPLGPVGEAGWPSPYDEAKAAAMRATLTEILKTCIQFAKS